jgi:flagellar biosynthesis protein FlhB
MAEGSDDKTFDATPQKIAQMRKEGQIPKARDAGSILATGAILAVLLGGRTAVGHTMRDLFMRSLGDLSQLSHGDITPALHAASAAVFAIAIPCAVAAAIASVGIGVAQTGMLLNFDLVAVKPERLNPLPNLKQLFSMKKGGVEVLLALLRVGAVGYVAYRSLLLELPTLLTLSDLPLETACMQIEAALVRVVTSTLLALVVIAGADYGQARFRMMQDAKMSRKEVMDEAKSEDGDPKVKGRMRARARALAKKRSIQNVKTAAVVVTNPTHISVALRYGDKDPSPVVVSKGEDDLAMLIRKEARKHGIPILENRALARALHAAVEIGKPVPSEYFVAVARVLAFVYRLKGVRKASVRGGAGGTRRA